MNWHQWIDQQLPYTQIKRGGATVWPKGAGGLIGDSLGPIMHIHDDASEIFYFVSGRCRLEIGDSEEIFEAGDFVLVPPLVPHNLWNAGDDDLLVFWLVAPNFINNKWRTDNFPPGANSLRAIRGRVQAGEQLPSDDKISSRLLTLHDGKRHSGRTGAAQEAILYVVEGTATIQVGKLSGTLTAHDFVGVPVGTDYAVSGTASVILFQMPGGA